MLNYCRNGYNLNYDNERDLDFLENEDKCDKKCFK